MMIKKALVLIRSSMFRWWLMIVSVFAIFPSCPCCGRQGCPGGIAAGALLGGIVAAAKPAFLYLKNKLAGIAVKIRPADRS